VTSVAGHFYCFIGLRFKGMKLKQNNAETGLSMLEFYMRQNWVGALPANFFTIKTLYFNALKSSGSNDLYH